MSNSQAMVSRQATPSNAPVAMQAQTDALVTRAKMVASCPRDMLPKQYHGNVGACLLAVDWAERNDVGILEALGQVAFVHGKPVVSAVMQRKLAARAGYGTKLIDGNHETATVAVIDPDGNEVGRATYTIGLAQDLDLVNKSAVWKADPAHMLVLRATTRALMYYGPADLAVTLVDDETPPAPDPTPEPGPVTQAYTTKQVATPAPENAHPPADPVPGFEPAGEPKPSVVGLVQTGEWNPEQAEADIRKAAKTKGVKVADLCRHFEVPMVSELAATYDSTLETLAWIDEQ